MSDISKFDIRDWLLAFLVVPILLVLLITAVAVMKR